MNVRLGMVTTLGRRRMAVTLEVEPARIRIEFDTGTSVDEIVFPAKECGEVIFTIQLVGEALMSFTENRAGILTIPPPLLADVAIVAGSRDFRIILRLKERFAESWFLTVESPARTRASCVGLVPTRDIATFARELVAASTRALNKLDQEEAESHHTYDSEADPPTSETQPPPDNMDGLMQ